ncbi:MAG: SDR family oxidoreductase [Gemmatimonadaceae bacterium]
MRFSNRTVVLTGVGREGQVGEVVARAFASEGARVVMLDRDAGRVEARAASLRASGFDIRAIPADLTDPAQVGATASEVGAAYDGRVDALVNMAGGFAMSGPVADSDPAVWQRMVAINLTTAYLATRAFLPLLRPGRGAILYFASVAAAAGGSSAGMAGYAAAKSGVLALMRGVAEEERAAGVRANALAPNAIRTADNVAAMGASAPYVEREDVAGAALFLTSDAARAITGQTIVLG